MKSIGLGANLLSTDNFWCAKRPLFTQRKPLVLSDARLLDGFLALNRSEPRAFFIGLEKPGLETLTSFSSQQWL